MNSGVIRFYPGTHPLQALKDAIVATGRSPQEELAQPGGCNTPTYIVNLEQYEAKNPQITAKTLYNQVVASLPGYEKKNVCWEANA